MINLTCTNCTKILQIDDAFAGGVCRCKFCGRIQTVPAHKTRAAAPTAAVAAPKSAPPPKTLFKAPAHAPAAHAPPTSGTGLDELAQIVASSGLAGTGLRSPHLRTTPVPPPPATNLKLYVIIGGGILGLLIVVLLIWIIMHQSGNSTASNDSSQSTSDNQAVTTNSKQSTANT